MTESEGNCEKMAKQKKKGVSLLALTGAAAVIAIAANLAITAIKYRKEKNAKKKCKKGTLSFPDFDFLLLYASHLPEICVRA